MDTYVVTQRAARLRSVVRDTHPAATSSSPLHGPADPRTQMWTTSFRRLAQDYLARLTQLVDEYKHSTALGYSGGHSSTHSNQLTYSNATTSEDWVNASQIPLRLRSRGLGGDVQEDAAMELDVDDLRRAERVLLLELFTRQRQQQQQHLQEADHQGGVKTSEASIEMPHSAVAASSHRTSTAFASAAVVTHPYGDSIASKHTSRAGSNATDALTGYTTRTSVSSGVGLSRRDRKSTTSDAGATASANDPPIPEELLELFRYAQQLSSSIPALTPSITPATSPNPARKTARPSTTSAAAAQAVDKTEVEMLARLCMKYFLTPTPVPVPATLPPSPQSDRQSSPADKRRLSRQDPLYSNLAGQDITPKQYSTQEQRCRAEGKQKNVNLIDTFAPPPYLQPRAKRQQQPSYASRQGPPVQLSPHSRVSFSSPELGNAAESNIPMSLSGPAAWRKLINKCTAAAEAAAAAAASTDHTQVFPEVTPSTTSLASPSRTCPVLRGQVLPARDKNSSSGLPPPRALFKATNASEVLEALSKEEKDGPLSRHLGGYLRLKQSTPNRTLKSGVAVQDGAQRLPARPLRSLTPTPFATRAKATTKAAAVSAPAGVSPHVTEASPAQQTDQHGSSPSTQLHLPPVMQVKNENVRHQHLPTPAPAAAAKSPATATVSQGQTKKMKKSNPSAAHLLPTVVLPPHYHGLHGEKLSTLELEQLVKSVAQERAEAQANLDNTHRDADTAAETLYALQQSVARVLLENLQLEKDIVTLSGTSPTRATQESNEVDERACERSSAQFGTSSVSPATSILPAVMPPRRALLALPAPAPNAATLFSNSLFANASSSSHQHRTRKGKAKKRKGRSCPTTATTRAGVGEGSSAGLSDALDSHHDPLAVLEELRAATAARQAEQAHTLTEIASLTARIARHDALLQAVAEYWRRNAAVMKRQQFAVQAQPKLASDTDVTWRSGTATTTAATTGGMPGTQPGGRRTSRSPPTSSSSPLACTTRSVSPVSVTQRSSNCDSSATRQAEASTTPPSRVQELLESPSQLERALAHMEAVSPTLPSSAVSFDLHSTPSRTTENSSAPPTLRSHRSVNHKSNDGKGETEVEIGSNSTFSHHSSLQQSHRHSGDNGGEDDSQTYRRHPHAVSSRRVQREGLLSVSSLPSDAVSGPTTATTTTGTTTRMLFSSPEPLSESGEREERVKDRHEQLREGTGGRRDHSTDASVKSGSSTMVPSLKVAVDTSDRATVHLPVTPPSLIVESAALRNDGRPPHTLDSLLPNTAVTAGTNRREEEEEVLQVGSWRTIGALQLEKVDEIAEFIYSVFENA